MKVSKVLATPSLIPTQSPPDPLPEMGKDEEKMGKKVAPIRCFEGSARPHEPFWRIRDAVDADGEAEVELYGWISEYSWLDDDITPKMFKEDLMRAGKGGPVTIRMNSGGGDVIAASMMRAIIMDYPGRVTVRIDGLAASAATVVATAGDRVLMQDTGYFMIHDPMMVFMMAALNIEELKRIADTLSAVKDGIVGAYASKTGLSRERLGKMMTAETWLSAGEAQKLGFVDEVLTPKDKGVKNLSNLGIVNALKTIYNRVPVSLEMEESSPLPPLEKGGKEVRSEANAPYEQPVDELLKEVAANPVVEGEEDVKVGETEAAETATDKLSATARRLRAECQILTKA